LAVEAGLRWIGGRKRGDKTVQNALPLLPLYFQDVEGINREKTSEKFAPTFSKVGNLSFHILGIDLAPLCAFYIPKN
jgi:hypothetical protein